MYEPEAPVFSFLCTDRSAAHEQALQLGIEAAGLEGWGVFYHYYHCYHSYYYVYLILSLLLESGAESG